MSDVHLIRLAARQHNRLSFAQIEALGYGPKAVDHRVRSGRLVAVERGVYGFAPVLPDDLGRWMGATLTAPGTFLSHVSASSAAGFWTPARDFETVTREGSGGPVRHGGVLVFRSIVLEGDTTTLGPIPITAPERTLLDLAPHLAPGALARAVREAVRLKLTTLERLADAVERHRGRRGIRKLMAVLAAYAGLPLDRARSGAEVRAMLILRDAGRPLPELNRRIAGEEADLSWRRHRMIIEIDGGPFHLDAGEDARKQSVWEGAAWNVFRISSDDVYERPERLLALAPSPNVADTPL